MSLIDVRVGLVFLMDNYHALTRPTRFHQRIQLRKFRLRSGPVVRPSHIAVCQYEVTPLELQRITFRRTLPSLHSLSARGLYVA